MKTLKGLRGPKRNPDGRKHRGKRPPPINANIYNMAVYVAKLRGQPISDFVELALYHEVEHSEYLAWKTKADLLKED